ncbi:hypothetical protein Tco_0836169 [Tanacetum coccineum]
MGCCLTSWFSKKQTALAIYTTETEYVSARKACQQAIWMKQALIDYGVRLDDILIMCDNKRAIDLSKNPVQHSRTKHIEIRHHFLRDNVQKGNITIEKVTSEDNIADILAKPLKREPFNYLRLACMDSAGDLYGLAKIRELELAVSCVRNSSVVSKRCVYASSKEDCRRLVCCGMWCYGCVGAGGDLKSGGVWREIIKINEELGELGIEFPTSFVPDIGERMERWWKKENGWITCGRGMGHIEMDALIGWQVYGQSAYKDGGRENAHVRKIPVRVELDKRDIDLDSILCLCCDSAVGDVNAFSISELFAFNGNVDIPNHVACLWQAVRWTSVTLSGKREICMSSKVVLLNPDLGISSQLG